MRTELQNSHNDVASSLRLDSLRPQAGLYILLLFILSFCLPLAAADLPLTWDNPNPSNVVQQFLIWRSYTGSNFNLRILLGSTPGQTFTISNVIASETNSFAVSATNSIGESALSVPLVIPPINAPVNLANRALVRTWSIPPAAVLQRSFDLTKWAEHLRNVGSNAITVRISEDAFGRLAFFRLATNAPALPPLPGGGK